MIRIAFYLGGPVEMAFDQQPARITARRHCRCVEQRNSGNDVFRLPDVGNDVLRWLACTCGRAGHGQ